MEVIILESQAFYRLIEEIEKRAILRKNMDEYMTEQQVMSLFHIANRNHFSMYRTKHMIPCYKKPGTRSYLYVRSEVEAFIRKNRVYK